MTTTTGDDDDGRTHARTHNDAHTHTRTTTAHARTLPSRTHAECHDTPSSSTVESTHAIGGRFFARRWANISRERSGPRCVIGHMAHVIGYVSFYYVCMIVRVLLLVQVVVVNTHIVVYRSVRAAHVLDLHSLVHDPRPATAVVEQPRSSWRSSSTRRRPPVARRGASLCVPLEPTMVRDAM